MKDREQQSQKAALEKTVSSERGLRDQRDWCFIAEKPAPAPHLARPEGRAALTHMCCGSRLQMKDRELQSQKAALEKTTAGLEDQKKQLLQVWSYRRRTIDIVQL